MKSRKLNLVGVLLLGMTISLFQCTVEEEDPNEDPSSSTTEEIIDCNGVEGGTAYIDECGICVGGDTYNTPCLTEEGSGVNDVDGNSYKTVIIGDQEWMASNLQTTKYNDGTSIEIVTSNTLWSNTDPMMCYYDNDLTNKSTYGGLYNWYVVNTGKVCPSGWHVPTTSEFATLENFLDADGDKNSAGYKLKSRDGWNLHSSYKGSDRYGFEALPAGIRFDDGEYKNIDYRIFFWTTISVDNSLASCYLLSAEGTSFSKYSYEKEGGSSIRCLKD